MQVQLADGKLVNYTCGSSPCSDFKYLHLTLITESVQASNAKSNASSIDPSETSRLNTSVMLTTIEEDGVLTEKAASTTMLARRCFIAAALY